MRRLPAVHAVATVLLGLMCAAVLICAGNQARALEAASIATEIHRQIDADAVADLRRVYQDLGYAPLWQASPEAAQRRERFFANISHAADDGLPAAVFHMPQTWAEAPDAAVAARRDIDATRMLFAYVDGQRHGFVPRAALGPDWAIAPEAFDTAGAIVAAVKTNDLDGLLADASAGAQVQGLRAALVRLRPIAAAGGWPVIPGTEELQLGTGDAREALLIKRLVMEGDLPDGAAGDTLALRAAVRQFQVRHGLDSDGRIGRKTLAALSGTVEERITTIAVNLERRRHLPRAWGKSYIQVNAADASLTLVEKGAEALRMRTIIGDPDHPTPVMHAMISAVTLNPSWTIPSSIANKEILPKLRRNPRYLADNNIVIVGGPADDPHGLNVDWKKIRVGAFPFVLRQQPGVQNALGAVKFEMANGNAVFLHDTPGRGLFARAERSLSHGCVRLELPIDLACHLLFGAASDDKRSEIVKIIQGGATRTMTVPAPLPVYILYETAFIDRGGLLNVRHDIYSRDQAIARALASLGRAAPFVP